MKRNSLILGLILFSGLGFSQSADARSCICLCIGKDGFLVYRVGGNASNIFHQTSVSDDSNGCSWLDEQSSSCSGVQTGPDGDSVEAEGELKGCHKDINDPGWRRRGSDSGSSQKTQALALE